MTPHVAAESTAGAAARVDDARHRAADEWPSLGPGETVEAVLRLRPTSGWLLLLVSATWVARPAGHARGRADAGTDPTAARPRRGAPGPMRHDRTDDRAATIAR